MAISTGEQTLESFTVGRVQSFRQFCNEYLSLPPYTPAATEDSVRDLTRSCDEYIRRESNYPTRDCVLQLDNTTQPLRWVTPRGGAAFRKEGELSDAGLLDDPVPETCAESMQPCSSTQCYSHKLLLILFLPRTVVNFLMLLPVEACKRNRRLCFPDCRIRLA